MSDARLPVRREVHHATTGGIPSKHSPTLKTPPCPKITPSEDQRHGQFNAGVTSWTGGTTPAKVCTMSADRPRNDSILRTPGHVNNQPRDFSANQSIKPPTVNEAVPPRNQGSSLTDRPPSSHTANPDIRLSKSITYRQQPNSPLQPPSILGSGGERAQFGFVSPLHYRKKHAQPFRGRDRNGDTSSFFPPGPRPRGETRDLCTKTHANAQGCTRMLPSPNSGAKRNPNKTMLLTGNWLRSAESRSGPARRPVPGRSFVAGCIISSASSLSFFV